MKLLEKLLDLKSAKYWIEKLKLEKHPEGGWFKEIYRAKDMIPAETLSGDFSGSRNCSTSIYYLLEGEDFSSFHRIKSDEIWHYYAGTSSVEIISIDDGKIRKQQCGNSLDKDQHLQIVVPKNRWFAARLRENTGFALVGCTVSPGFHFEDFELASKNLIIDYPELESEIMKLIRL